MNQIETTRTERPEFDDWRVEVIGLTQGEAFAVSNYVAQIIIARGASTTNYFIGKGDNREWGDDQYAAAAATRGGEDRVGDGVNGGAVGERLLPGERIVPGKPSVPSVAPPPRDRFSGLDLSLEKPE